MWSSDYHGLLVIDKPVGLTSRAAVDGAAGWFPRKTRIGHTGTLDPLASGVLVLCVGHATRLTEYVQAMPKMYAADLILGASSVTDDTEGPITSVRVGTPPSRAAVAAALSTFVGLIEQVPPAYSAAKVGGRRAYDLARGGAAVALAPRTVRIDAIDLAEFDYPRLRIEVRCGKGTYIRALARDLGDRLGCGAYVDGLRRTRVGPFSADDAVPLECDAETARGRLLPMTAAVANLPQVNLPPDAVKRLRTGQTASTSEDLPGNGEVAILNQSGGLAAIAFADDSGRRLRPAKVFPA
ncbi:MAG TPA: tRNA pseudouridine(55) synthase TruB [Gemmataceae bacterium]|jgi:tRNA pseudouridine55 synthase|nr:tRNA pseudouridine(55) synthase TruB [Gemmataceae bacterium]